jgi:hypothetical protein
MKITNLVNNIYPDRMEFDWRELEVKNKIKVAVAILFGTKFIIYGETKFNLKNDNKGIH